MNEQTYREHLNDLQLEVEELRAQLKGAQTGDTISRQAALDALDGVSWMHLEGKHEICDGDWIKADEAEEALKQLPSAQPKQRYTEEELRVFKHGISLSLLSKRSSQHWQYDEDTATEIKFLERLYEKVSADMRGAE